MGFTPFVDDLGLIVVLIMTGAALLAWTSFKAFLALFRNDPAALRAILKASAVPAGIVGSVALAIGLWIEYTWPFLQSDGMGSYDIFFGDVVMIFAMAMLVYAVVTYKGLRLEYAGLFGGIAGATCGFYGIWGYTTLVSPGTLGLTKDPLETFLLYGAYGMMGLASFPAALILDWYLEHPGRTWTPVSLRIRPSEDATEAAPSGGRFRLPWYVYIMTMWFPIFAVLAMVAAWFYLGAILPGHLTSPP